MVKNKIIDYCLSLKGTTEHFPFDENHWVPKVGNKMFAIMDISKEEVIINLKSDPEYAEQLRLEYENILPGYHMSKKHWNTIIYNPQYFGFNFLCTLINNSYNLVYDKLTKKEKQIIDENFI